MARGTFSGGIHPYEGKELSKMKPIKEFKVINFETTRFRDYTDLCNLYNTGEVADEIYDEFYQVSDVKPEELITDAAAAFGDKEDNKRRYENKTFAELLTF